jgi:hypothetical protein
MSALVIFGVRSNPYRDPNTHPLWLRPWIFTVGIGLLGLTFLVASIVALRNRRRGGLVFLFCAPIVAFCLAFPEAGFLKWEASGDGIFYSPFFLSAVGLSLLFYAPFLVPLVLLWVTQNRKRAFYLFLILVVAVSPVFVFSRWTPSLLPRLAAWSALVIAFGAFWLGTHKLGWPSVVVVRPRSLGRRIAGVFTVCLFVAILDVLGMFVLSARHPLPSVGDCSGSPPFSQPEYPEQMVFVARTIRTGHAERISDRWVGTWALGVVQDRFWGLPSWTPRIVLLTGGIFWENETYFVDAHRADGLVARYLPIAEHGRCGSRTRPLVDAAIEMRVLHENRLVRGAGLIGFVRRPERYAGELTPPIAHVPYAGAKISVKGSSGVRTVTADQEGIFEIDDLPLDNYTLTLDLPDSQIAHIRRLSQGELARSKLVECDVYVEWNGTIEGQIKDVALGPARGWLQLQNPDGTDVGPAISAPTQDENNGSFRLAEIPPGRYILMISPSGPTHGFPYAPVYYPTAVRPGDAQVFEIAEGQHIRNVDFVLKRLPERKVRVRVTWPNGQPVDGASVHVAYEHTQFYSSPRDAPSATDTDHTGETDVSVFGDLRIRMSAAIGMGRLDEPPWYKYHYSVPLEFQADKVPDKIDLILTASDPGVAH